MPLNPTGSEIPLSLANPTTTVAQAIAAIDGVTLPIAQSDVTGLVDALTNKAGFVRLTIPPTNADVPSEYELSGSLSFDGTPLTTPITLTYTSENVWENGGSSLLISDGKWQLSHEGFFWQSVESAPATLPQVCTFNPTGSNEGTPVLTFSPAIAKTPGQFALVDNNTDDPVLWENLGTDVSPDWKVSSGKADFVRLTANPGASTSVSRYGVSGGDLAYDGSPVANGPPYLNFVSANLWQTANVNEAAGVSSLQISNGYWQLNYGDSPAGTWISNQTTATRPENCTWSGDGYTSGTPILTFFPQTIRAIGQFALVNDGTNPPVMWQNLANDANPSWVALTTATALSAHTAATGNVHSLTATQVRSILGVSTLSGSNTGDQNLSSYATSAAVAAGYQPLDSDLTSIAALTTTSTGRALLTESVTQTGTGALVRAASPTLTGTLSAAAITASGTLTCNGNLNLAAPKSDGGSDVCILTSAGNLVIERKDWSAGGTSGNITLRTGVSQVAVDRFRVNPFGRILMGATLPTDDGSSAVQINGNLTASGTLQVNAPSGFANRYLDLNHNNGQSLFAVESRDAQEPNIYVANQIFMSAASGEWQILNRPIRPLAGILFGDEISLFTGGTGGSGVFYIDSRVTGSGANKGPIVIGARSTSYPSGTSSDANKIIDLALPVFCRGNLTASGTIRLGTFTVGTLPSAAANTRAIAYVTDSSVSTYGSVVAGGGSTQVMVLSNGTDWVVSGGGTSGLGTFTKAQLDTAVSDGNVLYVGDAPTAHNHAGSEITSGTVDPARLGSGSSITTKFLRGDSTWQSISGGGDALVANSLDQFADVTQTGGATLSITSSTTLGGGSHSGTNTGDNAVNSLYSGLVSNATHTGDVTGDTVLTIANSAVTLAKTTGIQKVITSGTAAPSGGVDGDIYLQYT